AELGSGGNNGDLVFGVVSKRREIGDESSVVSRNWARESKLDSMGPQPNIVVEGLPTNDHYENVLPVNNNSLVHENYAIDPLKHENDRLMELLISQDLMHTSVNSLATINDYKSMEQRFVMNMKRI
ncbi:hypothetical protein Tco_1365343, partial [Tanacetum coccineum]